MALSQFLSALLVMNLLNESGCCHLDQDNRTQMRGQVPLGYEIGSLMLYGHKPLVAIMGCRSLNLQPKISGDFVLIQNEFFAPFVVTKHKKSQPVK